MSRQSSLCVENTPMAKVGQVGFLLESEHLQAKREDYLDVGLPDCWPCARSLAECIGKRMIKRFVLPMRHEITSGGGITTQQC